MLNSHLLVNGVMLIFSLLALVSWIVFAIVFLSRSHYVIPVLQVVLLFVLALLSVAVVTCVSAFLPGGIQVLGLTVDGVSINASGQLGILAIVLVVVFAATAPLMAYFATRQKRQDAHDVRARVVVTAGWPPETRDISRKP